MTEAIENATAQTTSFPVNESGISTHPVRIRTEIIVLWATGGVLLIALLVLIGLIIVSRRKGGPRPPRQRRPMSMSSGTYRPRQETGGENPAFTPPEEIYSWSLYNSESSTSRPTMPDRWQNLDFANQCNGRQRENATAEPFTVETSNSFRYIPGNRQEGSDNAAYVYNGAMSSGNTSNISPLYDSAPPPYSRYPETNHTSSQEESEQGSRRPETTHSQGRSRAPRNARRTDTSQNPRRPPTPHNSLRPEMHPDSQVEISRRQETREQSIREDTTIRWI